MSQVGDLQISLRPAKLADAERLLTWRNAILGGIPTVDEEARQIWFQASGMNADQDPYFVHYYRINFDGTGLTALTRCDAAPKRARGRRVRSRHGTARPCR